MIVIEFQELPTWLSFASTADVVLYSTKNQIFEPELLSRIDCTAIDKRCGIIYKYAFLGSTQSNGGVLLDENLINQRCVEFIALIRQEIGAHRGKIDVSLDQEQSLEYVEKLKEPTL